MKLKTRILVVGVAIALAALMAWLVLPPDEKPEPIQSGPRIISFSPALTETLFELGVGEQVIGADNWSLQRSHVVQSQAGTRITNLGSSFTTVNPEQVIRLKPTLILAQKTSATANLDPIKGLKARYEEIPFTSMREMMEAYRRVGELTGTAGKAEELVARIESQLVPVTGGRLPRVLVLNVYFQESEPSAVGGRSYQTEILERIGAKNVLGDEDRPTVTMAPEPLAKLEPDIVILLGSSPDQLPQDHFLRRFQAIDAVREKRVWSIDGRESMEQGPSGVLLLVESLKRVLKEWQQRGGGVAE